MIDPLGLLSALGSGLRALTGVGRPAPREPLDAASFAELLKQAEGGGIESGLPISIARGVEAGLSEAQLEELGRLADEAEAAGLTNVLVLVESAGDGAGGEAGPAGVRGLLLDVQGRTITGAAEPSERVIRGVDGVLRLGGRGEADREPAPLPPAGLYARSRLALREEGGEEGSAAA